VIYVLEIYSTRIRGAASSFTYIAGRLFTALMPIMLEASEEIVE